MKELSMIMYRQTQTRGKVCSTRLYEHQLQTHVCNNKSQFFFFSFDEIRLQQILTFIKWINSRTDKENFFSCFIHYYYYDY
jgi:hypothetical protein